MTLEFPSYETISVEITDHVAHVVLNRPEKRNAMNKAFWVEFPDAINRISNKAAARVIVVSSTGKHFTAGMDLAVFAEAGSSIMGGADQDTLRFSAGVNNNAIVSGDAGSDVLLFSSTVATAGVYGGSGGDSSSSSSW